MPGLKELDPTVTLADQVSSDDDNPIVLTNAFTVDAEEEQETLLKGWAHNAEFMKAQPGYISTQLHKGIVGSSTLVNYVIWQDVDRFRSTFINPEFQTCIVDLPLSAVAQTHLFGQLSIANFSIT